MKAWGALEELAGIGACTPAFRSHLAAVKSTPWVSTIFTKTRGFIRQA
jgi:hypothetical protein